MKATKSTFEATAEILRVATRNYQLTGTQAADVAANAVKDLALQFADMYQRSNPAFNRARFLATCKPGAR